MRALLALIMMILIQAAMPSRTHAGNFEDYATTETVELLRRVEVSGSTFIRNGSKHEAKEAADHLRSKVKRAGKRMTTEQFIQKIASKSSSSGDPYHIVTPDGKQVKSEDWFLEQLADIRGGKAPPAPVATATPSVEKAGKKKRAAGE